MMYNFDDVDLAIIGIVIIDALSLACMHDKAFDLIQQSIIAISALAGGRKLAQRRREVM